MTNREFYAYCREERKVEQDPPRRAALWDVYGYMRECGVTRRGVRQFVERRVYEEQGNDLKIEALQWVLAQFAGMPSAEYEPENPFALDKGLLGEV